MRCLVEERLDGCVMFLHTAFAGKQAVIVLSLRFLDPPAAEDPPSVVGLFRVVGVQRLVFWRTRQRPPATFQSLLPNSCSQSKLTSFGRESGMVMILSCRAFFFVRNWQA